MDDDELFAPPVPTADQIERAAAKGWPDGLVARMHSVRYPSWKVEQALGFDGWPTPEMIVAELEGRERLSNGLQDRLATWEDDERLADLYAHSSERLGDWDVIVERSPNPFAQQRLQETWGVKLITDRGVALAANAQSGRSSVVAGQHVSVQWMGGWRVRNGHRRHGYAALLMNTPGGAHNVFGLVSYWYVRLENQTAAAWIDQQVTDTQSASGRAMAKLTASVHHFDAPTGGMPDRRVRAIEPSDVDRCVELVKSAHDGLDLFRPYSPDTLRARLDDLFWGPKPHFVPSVYGWPDMKVLEDAGEIVACAGLWDRGRDVRERWRHGITNDERVVDSACLMDIGHAPGRADALAALIDHHVATTNALGRTTLCAALEFLPDVITQCRHQPTVETRSLETMVYREPDIDLQLPIARPYTDLAYW
jgi:ribosome modulation factor